MSKLCRVAAKVFIGGALVLAGDYPMLFVVACQSVLWAGLSRRRLRGADRRLFFLVESFLSCLVLQRYSPMMRTVPLCLLSSVVLMWMFGWDGEAERRVAVTEDGHVRTKGVDSDGREYEFEVL